MKPPPVNPLGNSRHRDVGRSAYRNAGNSDYRALGKTAYRRWEALLTSSSVKNVTVYNCPRKHKQSECGARYEDVAPDRPERPVGQVTRQEMRVATFDSVQLVATTCYEIKHAGIQERLDVSALPKGTNARSAFNRPNGSMVRLRQCDDSCPSGTVNEQSALLSNDELLSHVIPP